MSYETDVIKALNRYEETEKAYRAEPYEESLGAPTPVSRAFVEAARAFMREMGQPNWHLNDTPAKKKALTRARRMRTKASKRAG